MVDFFFSWFGGLSRDALKGTKTGFMSHRCRYVFHVQIICLCWYLIISVHRTASCNSISLSLYWFLSISTRAISTRVNRRLWVIVMSPSCMGDENWEPKQIKVKRLFNNMLGFFLKKYLE